MTSTSSSKPSAIARFFRFLRRTMGVLLLLAVLGVVAFVIWTYAGRGEFRPKHRGFVRFALCQYGSRVGDIRWSFLNALGYAQEAVRHGADVVILPEFSFTSVYDIRSMTGHFNILERPEYYRRLSDFTLKNGCYLFFNHSYTTNSPVNHRPSYFNTSYVMGPDGTIVTSYVKRAMALLDKRCKFKPGKGPVVLDLPFARIGMMICKDSSFPHSFPEYRDADLVTIQFSHITHWGTNDVPVALAEPTWSVVDSLAKVANACTRNFRKPLLMVNKSGLETDFAYIGDSRVVIPNGTALAHLGSDCNILYADFPLGPDGRIDPNRHPIIPENPTDYELHDSLTWLWKLRRSLHRISTTLP